jgi:transposase
MTITAPIYGGIDVSKDTLEVARLGQKPTEQFANTKPGIAKLVKQMLALAPKLIVVEASGG